MAESYKILVVLIGLPIITFLALTATHELAHADVCKYMGGTPVISWADTSKVVCNGLSEAESKEVMKQQTFVEIGAADSWPITVLVSLFPGFSLLLVNLNEEGRQTPRHQKK